MVWNAFRGRGLSLWCLQRPFWASMVFEAGNWGLKCVFELQCSLRLSWPLMGCPRPFWGHFEAWILQFSSEAVLRPLWCCLDHFVVKPSPENFGYVGFGLPLTLYSKVHSFFFEKFNCSPIFIQKVITGHRFNTQCKMVGWGHLFYFSLELSPYCNFHFKKIRKSKKTPNVI